ncbi:MAG: PASTA domain-containing protein [Deltaproteobacteria bacterium]|nr:PASTA domain-containing protein [Deltaproteobacteria bacterium]
MKVQDKKWIRFRIYLVAAFFLIGLGIILSRDFQLQVLQRDRLEAIARASYKGEIKIPPKRGTIYDRERHELSVSIEVGSIYAHPNLVKNKAQTADHLALNLNEKQSRILPLLNKKSSFVWIKRRVSPEKVRQIKSLGLEGIGFTTETRRYYPGREIASNLLGFSGVDNQGLEGLEKRYDGLLKGPQHTLVQMRDALGRPFYISRPTSQNLDMHNLVLTIDKDIQYKAQQALDAAVKKAKAKSGQCLIMDPETGEILAMAVVPTFNPNIFGQYRPYQWRNRTITDCYEPGSTIKIFLLAAALEQSTVSPNTRFYCEKGEYQVANHVIHDTKKYGSLPVKDIIVLSSNIGAVKIGQELGYKKFSEYLKRFGFGSKTGIDLIGERRGFVRPVNKARQIDRATIFFGQGISSTSLQIATAMASIANGGKLMRPFVVKEITDQSGLVVKKNHPHMIRRVLSTETTRKVSKILEGVVSDRGTAPLAAITGYSVAGKTGTSQKVDPLTRKYSDKDYVAIFVGFVPANRPRLVILVMIDEPKGNTYGGLVAGPVFREVGAWTLNNLRVYPQLRLAATEERLETDDIEGPKFDPGLRPETENNGLLPDFRGQSMREVLRWGSSQGLKVLLEGSGLAVKQDPGPGSSLKKMTSVKVSFRPPA